MMPSKKSQIWNCYDVYEKLLSPYTQTVESIYLLPILKKQFQYCNKSNQPLSIATIKIPSLPILIGSGENSKGSMLLKKIISVIRADLRPADMVFYGDDQEITFLLPDTKKNNTKKMLNRIKNNLEQIHIGNYPLIINGGYAESPTDSIDFIKLQECVNSALNMAAHSKEPSIIGYFTERRKTIRIPLQIEVRYKAQELGERITCSRNLSEQGIMISGMPDLPQGDNIKLTFKLPYSAGDELGIIAKTIWNKIREKNGKIDIGLCLTNINSADSQKIKKYIQESAAAL